MPKNLKSKNKSNKLSTVKEYSNFITPPDFVDDPMHTITIIDALPEEIELVGKLCQVGQETYNIYLYRTDMNQPDWLKQAIDLSDAVIVHTVNEESSTWCKLDKVYYYGDKNYISPAHRVNSILDYFALKQNS